MTGNNDAAGGTWQPNAWSNQAYAEVQTGGKKESVKKNTSSEPTRTFKVIKIDGKSVKPYGDYKGDPSQAAKKAFSKLSSKKKKNKVAWTCIVTVRESTRGSLNKEFTYKGVQTKRSKPLVRKLNTKSGVNTFTVYVDRKVIAV